MLHVVEYSTQNKISMSMSIVLLLFSFDWTNADISLIFLIVNLFDNCTLIVCQLYFFIFLTEYLVS